MRRWWSKVCGAFRRRSLRDELDDEIRSHMALMADDLVGDGVDPLDAARAVRRSFRGGLQVREDAMEPWRFARLESLLLDLRHGLRSMVRAPGFTGAVLGTLALGIGVSTAVFSLLYGVLLRPLPYPEADRLVVLGESAGEATGISVTWGNLQHWREQSRSIEAFAPFIRAWPLTLTGWGEPVVATGSVVSHRFFELLGWQAMEGRVFGPEDDVRDAAPSVVVTHAFWHERLGGAGDVVGRSMTLDDQTYEVVGILPPDARFLDREIGYYLPIGLFFGPAEDRSRHGSIRALGRLAPGFGMDDARGDLDRVLGRLALSDPGPEDEHRADVVSLSTAMHGDRGPVLWLLMGAAVLVLALTCANVTNLLLGRAILRNREMAVRAALGAGRRRLGRQVLTETLLLAAAGGLVGVLAASLTFELLSRQRGGAALVVQDVGFDVPVLLFAAAVTALVGVASALAPALAQGRTLRGLRTTRGDSEGEGGHRLRDALVVCEVAMTLVLAFSSSLLVRSLMAAETADPGFEAGRLLVLDLQLPPARYPDGGARRAFHGRLVDALESRPGIEAVSFMGCPPGRGNCGDWWYSVEGRPPPPEGSVPLSRFDVAEGGLFRTMGVPVRAGREFDPSHGTDGPVVVVNETLARRWWSDPREAVGEGIKIGGPYQPGAVHRIVGVVADMAQGAPDAPVEPEFWIPLGADPRARVAVMIRTAGAPAGQIDAVRAAMAELDAALPIWSLEPAARVLAGTLDSRRYATWLLGALAALSMALAAVGIYGVLQQWVSARRREIALRMALGAEGASILGWACRHAGALVGLGLLAGAAGALIAARAFRALVFGLSPFDPGTFLGACAVVLILALLAAAVPLFRAVRVDSSHELQRT